MRIRADCIIIGAGAVGSAIAFELSKRHPAWRIAVLEKNETYGMETSRFNSGVIHSGLHLNPKSLKAKLAREGSKKIIEFCRQHDVPYRKCGMLVVGAWPKGKDFFGVFRQLQALLQLVFRARVQHIPVKLLSGRVLRALQPAITGFFGIFIEEVYLIDPIIYVQALVREAGGNVSFFCKHKVKSVEKGASDYFIKVENNDNIFETPMLINAAGLGAHEVAAMAGFDYEVYFYSGEYYRVVSDKKNAMGDTLVYPAIPPGKPGLGIHITRKIDGEVYLGPNAQLRADPFISESQWTPPEVFVEAIKPFWPAIEVQDIVWAFAGVRPKIVLKGEGDFIIKKDSTHPTMINLIGIESPGLTASLALAEYVSDLVE